MTVDSCASRDRLLNVEHEIESGEGSRSVARISVSVCMTFPNSKQKFPRSAMLELFRLLPTHEERHTRGYKGVFMLF